MFNTLQIIILYAHGCTSFDVSTPWLCVSSICRSDKRKKVQRFFVSFFSPFLFFLFSPPLLLFLVMVLQSIDTTIICKITVVLRGSTMSSSDSS